MSSVPFYIVDVFANQPYEGNQLAVFIDLEQKLSQEQMQTMAREINFAETSFIVADKGNQRFSVKIFTPEHEVPFAGHPSLGSAYIIAKFIMEKSYASLVLELKHADIAIDIASPHALDESTFFMRQAQPEFRETFTHEEVSAELNILINDLDSSWPIQEISTGLPYIMIPLRSLKAIENLSFDYAALQKFLFARQKYRSNSPTGHSTSLFFFTKETYSPLHDFNARMLLLENGRLSEDAATGSANGCLVAYLLKHQSHSIKATVEQGFQMKRPSFIYLAGSTDSQNYEINVGGRVRLVSAGEWYLP